MWDRSERGTQSGTDLERGTLMWDMSEEWDTDVGQIWRGEH